MDIFAPSRIQYKFVSFTWHLLKNWSFFWLGTKSSGFRGSLANGINNKYDFGNLAMTYCALASLIILGDDLSRINKKEIVKGLQDLQQNDGRYEIHQAKFYKFRFFYLTFSFIPVIYEKESDMRFVYCAATVCYM